MSGLFWWSATSIVDLPAEHRAAEIRDRHLDGLDAASAGHIRIDAREVIDVADDHVGAAAALAAGAAP